MDNLKISNVYPKVVDKIIDMTDKKYGEEAFLTDTQGKLEKYLGIKRYIQHQENVNTNEQLHQEGT